MESEIYRYRQRLDFVDWAPRFIENPDGTPFRFRETQVQPARDLFNPKISSVTIRAFSGAGKTYLIGAAMAYAVEQLRTASAVMFPNQVLAEDWVNEKLEILFASTPALERLRRERDVRRHKRWMTGAELFAVGANSAGQIRRLEASVMYSDEIDAIEQDSTDEGDKLDQFEMRGRGRAEQFKWRTSYPSLRGASKIDAKYDQSDRCRWYVRCVHCEHLYEMHTKQMVWTPKRPDSAHLICPNCARKITEDQRMSMAKAGEYLNFTRDKPAEEGARGLHLNCMAHVGDHSKAYGEGYLHEVAAKREAIRKAENPEKARRVFVNTMDAESYAEKTESKPEAHELYERRESDWNPNEELPAGVLMLTMGVDVQKDRLEALVMGWGLNSESWCVDYVVIPGSPLTQKPWNELDRLRARKWNHAVSERPLGIVCTMVDSGKWQDAILAYTNPRARQRVYACKGAKSIDRPLFDGKPTRVGSRRILQYHIGTHEAKDLIYQRLELAPAKDEEGFPRGYIHVPKIAAFGPEAGGEATGFFEMLTAEDSVMKRSTRTGEFVRFFDNPNRQRNEALDMMVYALGAERNMRPQYQKIAEGMGN